MKIGALTQCMHPGIGAARAEQGDRFSGHDLQGLFDRLLYGRPVFLPLPAVKRGAVIFDNELKIFLGFHRYNATDKEKKDKIVETRMDADAKFVSL